jgi:predicted amidohydrolase
MTIAARFASSNSGRVAAFGISRSNQMSASLRSSQYQRGKNVVKASSGRYFEPGDLGFPMWRMLGGVLGMCICNDRRWPETFRVLGLQGVEMVTLGFNTPSVNSQNSGEGLAKRMFHHKLSLQAGAYQNSTWVVAVAKCGVEDGHHCMADTVIVNPDGEIVAETTTEEDELLVHDCDLDATRFGKETMFDFARHRRIEHYGLIATQTGVVPPKG